MIWIIFVAVLVGMVFVSYLKKTNKDQHSSNETNTSSYSSNIQSSGYTSTTKPESPIPQNAKRVNFAVKGTMYRSAADINAARRVRVGDELTLIHEPHNDKDTFAMMVMTSDGSHIGYVEKKYSLCFYSYKDNIYKCVVSKVTNDDIPFIYANAFLPFDARIPDDFTNNNKRNESNRAFSFNTLADEDKNLKLDIKVYHESNIIISPLRVRYYRKYHELDGAVSHIPMGEESNYFRKYSIGIRNEALMKIEFFSEDDLNTLKDKVEEQFLKWAKKVERINNNENPSEEQKLINAARTFISANKRKMQDLDPNSDEYRIIRDKVQNKYDFLKSKNSVFKEKYLKELENLGIII